MAKHIPPFLDKTNYKENNKTMDYNKPYYQNLIYNLLDTLEYTADKIIKREDTEETEDFIDMVSNIIMEYAEITPEMEKYLAERGYGEEE